MKKNLLWACLLLAFQSGIAQTSLLYENFSNVTAPAFPTGWTVSNATDVITSNKTPSTGYSINGNAASGTLAARINPTNTGSISFKTPAISTTGFGSIKVSFGTYKSSNFLPANFSGFTIQYSTDNSTWSTLLSGVDNTLTGVIGTWSIVNGGNGINLPSDASNKSSLYILWTTTFTGGSGSYYVDDFTVIGTPITSTEITDNTIQDSPSFTIFPNPNNGENLSVNVGEEGTLTLVDLSSGANLKQIQLSEGIQSVNFSENVPTGIYLLKFAGKNSNYIRKYIVK